MHCIDVGYKDKRLVLARGHAIHADEEGRIDISRLPWGRDLMPMLWNSAEGWCGRVRWKSVSLEVVYARRARKRR